jgi:hypothetical protein
VGDSQLLQEQDQFSEAEQDDRVEEIVDDFLNDSEDGGDSVDLFGDNLDR